MNKPPPDRRAVSLPERIIDGLAKIGLALRVRARASANERGVSSMQDEILAVLLRKHGASLSEVAEALCVTRPTASDSVETLVRKGLVDKRRAQHDPRTLSLSLTVAGQREARSAAVRPEALRAAVDALPADEQATWARGLIRMIEQLEAGGALAGVHTCRSCASFQSGAHPGERRPDHCTRADRPLGELDIEIDCPELARVS